MIDQYLTLAQQNLDAGDHMEALRVFGLVLMGTASSMPQRRKALDGICATMTAQHRSKADVESVLAFGRRHLQTLARRIEFEEPLVGDGMVSIDPSCLPAPQRPR